VTRTGSDTLYGVRYDALGNRRSHTSLVRDADLGALDAPVMLAAGSHLSTLTLGRCTRAAFRKDGDAFAVPLKELDCYSR
jgi:hypothetical protein